MKLWLAVVLIGISMCGSVAQMDSALDDASIDEAEDLRALKEAKKAHAASEEVNKRKQGYWVSVSWASKRGKKNEKRNQQPTDKFEQEGEENTGKGGGAEGKSESAEIERRWRSRYDSDERRRSFEWPSWEDYRSTKEYNAALNRAIARDKARYKHYYGSSQGYEPPYRGREPPYRGRSYRGYVEPAEVDEKAAEETSMQEVETKGMSDNEDIDHDLTSSEMRKRGWWLIRSRERSRSIEWPSREDYWNRGEFDRAWNRAVARDKARYKKRYGSLKGYMPRYKPRYK